MCSDTDITFEHGQFECVCAGTLVQWLRHPLVDWQIIKEAKLVFSTMGTKTQYFIQVVDIHM